MEVEIEPMAGLRIGSSRGETHGHDHDQPEFGLSLSAPPEIELSKTQVLLDHPIQEAATFHIPFTIKGATPRRIELKFSYEVVEIKSGQRFAPSSLEMSIEVSTN